jgi:glycosyltransferase involved in cell wall biosynthesis
MTQSASPLRILLANATGGLGGAEKVVLALAERLPAYGIDVSFAVLQPGPLVDALQRSHIRTHVFPETYRFRNLPTLLRCSNWLTARLREDGAQILHSNLTTHLVGSWAAKRARVKELWHLHDLPSTFDTIHSINRRLPTDFCLFTTNTLRQQEPSLLHYPNAVVHPNCIDVPTLRAAASRPTDPSLRQRLGIGSGPFFLTVARLQEHKGHAFLIEAAARLAPLHPSVQWVIVGEARGEQQQAYLAKLRSQVAALHLEHRVIFTGFVSDADLTALFRAATALVHPALSEGYGLVLLEAMACDLPVIAAAATGPAEIIDGGRNGLLVPTADPAALAAAMERILREPALAEHLRVQAATDLNTRSIDTMVEETIAVYRQMLPSPTAP